MRTAISPPVHHHAGLRKREGQKSADGIERDEAIGDTAKKKKKSAAEYREDDDAIGINEPPPAVPKGVREVVVLRDGAAEARKIGKGGVGGERKNEKNGADGQIVEIAFAKNGGDEHGEKALVTGLARIRRSDAVNLHEIRNSRQQHRQNENNHGESALSVFHGGLAEGLHAVAHGLNTGQRRATAGENLEQQPVADGFGHGRRRRKGSRRRGMSAAEENAENACHDSNEKCADKEIGRNREDQASFAYAAEIEDGDDDQNAYADGHRVRQQGRNGGDQGADPRGNAHGSGEDVIREERGRGEQAGRCAQIETRYGIGAAAGGIGGDSLAIGEVHDHQQGDDGGADGNDVMNAEKAQGNQKTEGCFRAVRRGA